MLARPFNACCELAYLHHRARLERKPGEGTAFSPEGASEPPRVYPGNRPPSPAEA
jgi:hypothetical protein